MPLNVAEELMPVEVRLNQRPSLGDRVLVRLVRFFIRRVSPGRLHAIQQDTGIQEQLERHGIRLVNAVDGSIYLYFWCRTREAVQCLMEWIDSGQLAAAIEKLINLATAGEENLSVSCLLIKRKSRIGK